MNPSKTITLEVLVNAPLETAWACWTQPNHIMQWNFASSDWHCPASEIDLRVKGRFSSRMEAKDGSFGFDFWGTYDEIQPFVKIASTLGDGRKMEVTFEPVKDGIKVTERFETEDLNSAERQKEGWMAILMNYKAHTESVQAL